MKLDGCNPQTPPSPPPPHTHTHTIPMTYSTDRSKAVVRVLYSLLLCGTFYEAICLVLFCSCAFKSFYLCLALGRELIFMFFVRFALVWFCLFPLPLGVWEGLRVVIVALPGLFSYLFYYILANIFLVTRVILSQYFTHYMNDLVLRQLCTNFMCHGICTFLPQ